MDIAERKKRFIKEFRSITDEGLILRFEQLLYSRLKKKEEKQRKGLKHEKEKDKAREKEKIVEIEEEERIVIKKMVPMSFDSFYELVISAEDDFTNKRMIDPIDVLKKIETWK